MSEGLNENHTIQGLHLIGNEGDIDAQGFIKKHDPDGILLEGDVANTWIFTRIQPNNKRGVHKK